MEKILLLPALTGKFGSWRYYNVLMKIKDLVNPLYGVKTVPESKKIYTSENLNEILQRLEDPKRIAPLKSYLLKQKDRYFNSLTVAFTGGDPKWHPVAIKKSGNFKAGDLEYLNLKYGILELTGKEELFILDGQHRLLGLKLAYGEKNELGEEEISVMLVKHDENVEGKKRIRRIFVSLNRNAKPVSEGENIILEEDDASAILARRLVENLPYFKDRNVIAFNKNLNLKTGKNDNEKFTSLLALYSINEILLDNEALYDKKLSGKYVRIRPSDNELDKQYKIVEEFWLQFFSNLTKAKQFVESPEKFDHFKSDSGGLFYLRPIGQELLATFYKYLKTKGKVVDFKQIQKIEGYLNSDFWNYILFNPHKETLYMSKGNAFNYILYNLGYPLPPSKVNAIRTAYFKNSGGLKYPSAPRYIKAAKKK